jgi:hypothetical protein
MLERRNFLKSAGVLTAGSLLSRHALFAQNSGSPADTLVFSSRSMKLRLSPTAPELLHFSVDGLGKGRPGANIVDGNPRQGGYRVFASASRTGPRLAYRVAEAGSSTPPCWTFDLSEQQIVLTSQWSGEFQPPPLVFNFPLNQVHSTVLGKFGRQGLLATPVVMHFPCQGSVRITANVPELELTYVSSRPDQTASLSLPGATQQFPHAVYTLDVTAIYPQIAGIGEDPRFDAFRRNWLDALQINPSTQSLANNTASDSCAFCYYEYGDIARHTPALAEGLTALDIVRQTLDRILAGGFAYGMSAIPDHPAVTSDTYPSLVIAAADCVQGGDSEAWLLANYKGIQDWAESMLATDTNGNGLIKYAVSGNSGIWTDGDPKFRPSNWWDTIGFGYEDAYANALAYRALNDMANMADVAKKPADATRYHAAAAKLRAAYYDAFYDPATGVLAGWRSADGKLHDYYFPWVNGIAIHYGLVPKAKANAIMDKLMAKMQQVGYDKFNMGLPGNLISVAREDCVDRRGNGRFGCGSQPGNADGFQNYENGGATGSFTFFTLAALYDLGRRAEADKILFAMLDEYGKCGFSGRGPNGMSNDWRRWDGTPMGYEGLLTDNYYALLAVPLRQSETQWHDGYRPQSNLRKMHN